MQETNYERVAEDRVNESGASGTLKPENDVFFILGPPSRPPPPILPFRKEVISQQKSEFKQILTSTTRVLLIKKLSPFDKRRAEGEEKESLPLTTAGDVMRK